MANKFVWSGATGLNDGSSWADAYTSLMRDWGAEAGFTPATDFVYVRSVHSESANATLTITGSDGEGTINAVRVLSVVGDTTGTDPGALAAGASVSTITTTTNDIIIDEHIYIYGVSFFSIDDIVIATSPTDHDVTLESCRLELTGTASADRIIIGVSSVSFGSRLALISSDLDFASAGQGITIQQTVFLWVGGAVLFDVNTLIVSPAVNGAGTVFISGVDLSVLSSSVLSNGATSVNAFKRIVFSRCLMPTGGSIVTETIDVPEFRVESYHCQIGTDADPAYQMEIRDDRGKIVADTSRYRTGGASDGERATPISWDLDTNVGSKRSYPGHPLESPPIAGWTDGDGSTAHTYRIYFASDATINDDQLWFDLVGPNDAATNSLGVRKTTRVAPRTTASAYTTDGTSTWNGAGVTTKQYMQITYTPDKPGPIEARVSLAKASDNVYIDPKIYIDP